MRAIFLAGTATGMERSIDAGRTWHAVNGGLPARAYISALAVASSNPHVVYAGVWNGGLYVSRDAGSRWRSADRMDIALAHWAVTGIAVDPPDARGLRVVGGGDGIEASNDGGRTWTHTNGALLASVGVIAADPLHPAILLAGSNVNGVLKSTDHGRTWTQTGAIAMRALFSLAFNPFSPDVAFAAASNGLYETIDGARTWQADTRGIHAGADFRSVAVDPRNGANIVAATHGGDIYHSTDGGTSWTLAANAAGFPAYAIAFDPLRRGHVILGDNHGLMGSDDHGHSWRSLPALQGWQINVLAAIPH
jgi:photosystem II stability/assembly factor-like uncharacterized protein